MTDIDKSSYAKKTSQVRPGQRDAQRSLACISTSTKGEPNNSVPSSMRTRRSITSHGPHVSKWASPKVKGQLINQLY